MKHNGHTSESHWLRNITIGTALVTGAVIISPYILPAVGIGSAELAEDALIAMHGSGVGSGLAGAINSAISYIPLVGAEIAKGGMAAAVATGAIGIGGVLLGHFIENRDDGSASVRWGRVITAAALITSSLIALPSILTGISAGIVFLCAAFSGAELASSAVTMLARTLGTNGAASMAVSGATGAALALSHMLTCGVSIVPLCVAWLTGGKSMSGARGDEITANILVDAPTSANVPVKAELILQHADGAPLAADELAIIHTRPIHLFLINDSISDYQHVHPEPTGVPGVYRFEFTPQTQGRYSAWADFTMLADQKNIRVKIPIDSRNKSSSRPLLAVSSNSQSEGITASLTCDSPLQVGKPATVRVQMRDRSGNIINDLQPVMGAFAHLVGFSASGDSFTHTHPVGSEPGEKNQLGRGEFIFHITPDSDGMVKFYLQARRDGKDIYLPFVQRIKPGRGYVAKSENHAGHLAGGLSPSRL